MAYNVIGTDTSSWEGQIDMQKNRAAGASFIIPRAGYSTAVDKEFSRTWANAKGIMARGAYWYLDIRTSIRRQAEMFAEVLAADPGEIEPYADFEQARQFSTRPWLQTGKRGWNCLSASELYGFITYFEQAIVNRLGRWPWPNKTGIYTGYSYWREHGSTSESWADRPLWISEPDPVQEPSALMPWKTWKYWQTQFSADGPKYGTDRLIAKSIDLNCYNGTPEQFAAEYGMSNPNVLPETFTVSVGIEGQTTYVQSAVSAVIVDAFGITWSFPR